MDGLLLGRGHHMKDQYIKTCPVSESLCDKLPTEKEIVHPYPSLQFMSNAREISEELYNDFHNGEGELDYVFDRYNPFYILFYHLLSFDPTRKRMECCYRIVFSFEELFDAAFINSNRRTFLFFFVR